MATRRRSLRGCDRIDRREQTTKNKSPPIQRAARAPKRARRGRDDNSLCKCSVYLCTVQTKKHAKGVAPEKHAKGVAPEKHAKGVAPEKHAKGVAPEKHAKGVAPEKHAKGVAPEKHAKNIATKQTVY
jgi:hypothetical protein